jgi:hypothetical protein
MPSEYRCAIITGVGMAASQWSAVLPQTALQGGLAFRGKRMGTHADDPGAAIPANFPGLEEEINILPRPAVCRRQSRRYRGGTQDIDERDTRGWW